MTLVSLGPAMAQSESASAGTSGSLSGKVAPAHDHAVVLGTAGITDLAVRTEIAADGSFRFDRLRPGTYVLEVRIPSLGVALETVSILPGEETTVVVELAAGSHYEEIFVTGSIDARDPLDLATPTTSLSGQELALRSQGTLGETLAQEPGINSTFFGPGASRPVIRGLAGDRVRMLEGGLGTGDASAVSADHAVTAVPAQAERIEVVRGPATLLYGSSAIGGVVNVIDERIPTSRAATSLTGSLDLRGGSVDDERSGALNLSGGRGDWAWNLGVHSRETDDYDIPGHAELEEEGHDEEEEGHEEEEEGHDEEEEAFGFVPNSDTEASGARAGVTYFFGDSGYLGVSVSGFDTEYGLPGGHGHEEEGHEEEGHEEEEEGHEEEEEGHDEEEEEIVRIDMEQRRFDLRGEVTKEFGPFRGLRVRAGGTDYEHAELEGDEIGTLFFNEALEARVELVQQERGDWNGSLGLQLFDRDLEAIGEEAFLPPTSTQRWALFTLQEVERGEITWQLGARIESQDIDPEGPGLGSRSHDGLSGSLGLVWDASETFTLAASASRSVKLPAAEELFSDGPHLATRTFEIGDPELDEETGLGLDLSFRFNKQRVSGEITLFRQDFDGFIFQAFTGAEEDGLPVVVYSQQDAEFVGAEARARVELWESGGKHVHLRLVGDMVDAELDNGENLPRIPPLRLGAGLDFHSETWNATAEVRWADDQTDVAVNETPTDGYTLVNASLGYRFLFQSQIVDLLLRGRNLTDEEARVHTSFLKDSLPLPGRDVSFGVRLLF